MLCSRRADTQTDRHTDTKVNTIDTANSKQKYVEKLKLRATLRKTASLYLNWGRLHLGSMLGGNK